METNLTAITYFDAIENLRCLLSKIGRAEFRAYGYIAQLRSYRATYRAKVAA